MNLKIKNLRLKIRVTCQHNKHCKDAQNPPAVKGESTYGVEKGDLSDTGWLMSRLCSLHGLRSRSKKILLQYMCLTCHKHRPHLGKATPNGTTASPLVLHHECMQAFLRGRNARSDVHVVDKVAVPWQLSTKSTDTTVRLRGADRRNARLHLQ